MEDASKKMNKCPACGSDERKFFSGRNGYEIFRCLPCRTLYLGRLPEDLFSIYDRKYFWGAENGFGYVNYDKDKGPMKAVFEECLRSVENLVSKGEMLDVGAATGYFLSIAKKRGWRVSGVEIGSDAARAGQKKGLDIKTGTIAGLPGEKKFDAITMFDVIEHVPDPRTDLVKAKQLLKDKGALVIITPDSGSFYARLLGKHWHLIVPPEHVTLFNKKSLSDLLSETGFEILEIKRPGKSFTVEYILHTLFRWQKLGVWGWLLRIVKKYAALAEFRLPLNFGDNMLILARKEK